MDQTVGVAESAGVSEVGRITGMLFSPGKTLADIVRRPTWVVPVLLVALVAAATNFFLYDAVIVPMQIDRIEQNPNMSPEQAQRMEDQMSSPVAKTFGTIAPAVVVPIILLIQAGIVMLVGSLVMGGESSFKTVFAVCAWTGGLLFAVASIVQSPLYALVTHRMEPVASLAFLLPSESPSAGVRFLRGIFASIDIFQIWQLALLSMGVSLAYKKPRSFGLTCAIVVWIIGALFAGLGSLLSGRPS